MTKYEFTENLRKALSGRVSYSVVNENVAYYESYIDGEIRKGRREEEVLEALGDPRLIARTIIETSGQEETDGESGDLDRNGSGNRNGRIYRIPAWVFWIFMIVGVILILKLVGVVIMFALPVVVPVLLICWIYKMFRKR